MKSPFKFLDAYIKEDKDFFFGREAETEELHDKVYRSNLMLVYGASGTGKTSVIQCGLGNYMHSSDWFPIIIRKESNILKSTENKVTDLAITTLKTNGSTIYETLTKQLESLYLDYFKPLYLIYDQFEELFISGSSEEIEDFFNFLNYLMSTDIQVKIIIVVREEYLAYLTNWEHIIPNLFSNRIRIETLSSLKIKEIIKNSCNAYVIGLENENIVENIYKKLLNKDGIVELPHLQVYLDHLYKEAYNENTNKCIFTNELVESTGKLDDVLASFLNEQVAGLPDMQLGWNILKEFITDKGTKKSISQFVWQKIAQEKQWNTTSVNEILQQLIEHRVIRYSDKENTMELSHDSLAIRVFENLSAEEKQLIDIRNFLHTAFGNYKINGSYLTAKDVAYIEPFLPKLKEEKPILDFLKSSKRKIQKERLLKITTVVAIMTILAFVAIFSFWQQQKAVEAEQKAVKAKQEAIQQKEKAETALNNFLKEKQKNIRTKIKQRFETIESYKKAGFYKDARMLLDSIITMNKQLQDKSIEQKIKQIKQQLK